MSLVRRYSPALEPKRVRETQNVVELLSKIRVAVYELASLLAIDSSAKVADVLAFAHETRLVQIDGRIARALEMPIEAGEAPAGKAHENGVETGNPAQGDEPVEEVLLDYLGCPAAQLWGYREYIENRSVYSTQQGIKGAEFQRVLVIIDDEESNHFLFSYDKLFGIVPLSDTDRRNRADGKETSVERTRRLFYVCCSRAVEALAVICYTSQPDQLKGKVAEFGFFRPECVFGGGDL
jgi:DNA helicase-2/ATP-dependent DNA helicase PcrA